VSALINITGVSTPSPTCNNILGFHLDAPTQGEVLDARAVDVAGWVVGKSSPAWAIEFVQDGRLIDRIAVDFPRPDVAARFPYVPRAHQSGFRATLALWGTDQTAEFEIRGVLKDKSRATLAVVRGRHRWREDPNPAIASLVSVVITCYNQALFLGESVESVLAQTHPSVEIVVVDDGSLDNTEEVARRYPQVRYIRQENRGLAAARNAGLRRSNGDFLVFLDADDRLVPDALRIGMTSLRDHPECALVWGHYHLLSPDGEVLSPPAGSPVERDKFAALLRGNYIEMHGAVMFRRGVFADVGGYDERLHACEDYDLYFRIVRNHSIHCHGKVVAEYRRHAATMNRDSVLMLKSSLSVLRSQRRYASSKELKEAYRAGKERYRNHYGREVIRSTGKCLQRGNVWGGIRGLTVLLRHHPKGLVAVLRGLRI
jgi:glycosyltransferase involved in cell wall biosynthesis